MRVYDNLDQSGSLSIILEPIKIFKKNNNLPLKIKTLDCQITKIEAQCQHSMTQ